MEIRKYFIITFLFLCIALLSSPIYASDQSDKGLATQEGLKTLDDRDFVQRSVNEALYEGKPAQIRVSGQHVARTENPYELHHRFYGTGDQKGGTVSIGEAT